MNDRLQFPRKKSKQHKHFGKKTIRRTTTRKKSEGRKNHTHRSVLVIVLSLPSNFIHTLRGWASDMMTHFLNQGFFLASYRCFLTFFLLLIACISDPKWNCMHWSNLHDWKNKEKKPYFVYWQRNQSGTFWVESTLIDSMRFGYNIQKSIAVLLLKCDLLFTTKGASFRINNDVTNIILFFSVSFHWQT